MGDGQGLALPAASRRHGLTESAERWQRKKELFAAVGGVAPERRAAFLRDECAGDEELLREMRELLAASDQMGDFLEGGLPECFPPSEEDPLVGAELGPWRLEELLGRGGMGSVYRARRADGEFAQEVAVKVVRNAPESGEIGRRFLAERRILASLTHPGIARLYDGGTTVDGLAYFVMELVDGSAITRYCDERRLSVGERLELFRKVCSAVEAAHRSLVVHRDLKPSNILVTAEGEPKLLDFGIAKLLDPEAPVDPPTRTAVRPMTAEYASPEQVRGEAITTASDVYSLGVLLYELLTGRRPHDRTEHTPRELERAICEDEPDRPSTVVTRIRSETDPTTAGAILMSRGCGSRELRRRLGGDLDNIALVALRKEPHRRYPSVERLADDVRRHLAGLPVEARGDSQVYRLSKFVRRHRVSVVFALLVVALLVSGAVSVAWQARIAAQERDRAQLAAARAARVSEFLREMLASPDPARRGHDVRVTEILEDAVERATSELSDQPELQASVLETLGATYEGLGIYVAAQEVLEQALELRRRRGQPDLAPLLALLGQVAVNRGDYDAAELRYQEAISHAERLDPGESAALARGLDGLAGLLRNRGEFGRAETLYRDVLEMRRRLLGELHPDVAQSWRSLASVFMWVDLAKADALFRQASPTVRRTFPEGHPELAKFLSNQGWVRLVLGDTESAERLTRETIEMQRRLLGDEHPDLALALLNLAIIRQDSGDLEAADALYRESWAIQRKLLGPAHPESVENLIIQALYLMESDETERGEALMTEALTTGAEHPYVALSLDLMADYLGSRGRHGLAERLARRSLEIRRLTLGPAHRELGPSVKRLADALRAQGRHDEADALEGRGPAPGE